MTDSKNEQANDYLGGNAIRQMFILALLYLPLGFFLWFFAASLLMWPSGLLAGSVLSALDGQLFERLVQLDFIFEIQTGVVLPEPVDGQQVALNLEVNPMIYAWGMALLFGLSMATPLSTLRRVAQLAVGFLVVTLITTWGVCFDALTQLAFRSGPEAAMAARGLGLSMEFIALGYQLGYLMLPGVVSVATWIVMNRAFIETHVIDKPR
ncbi:MAG: exosortase H-associated membrane protein [Wenzhouxiangella sp.]|nr:exosortase H-associated membrane protein [Wenzhouxiangella sp.]